MVFLLRLVEHKTQFDLSNLLANFLGAENLSLREADPGQEAKIRPKLTIFGSFKGSLIGLDFKELARWGSAEKCTLALIEGIGTLSGNGAQALMPKVGCASSAGSCCALQPKPRPWCCWPAGWGQAAMANSSLRWR
jgi:hypothetical protein